MKNAVFIFLLFAASAHGINGPGGDATLCVWRPHALHESPDTSMPVKATMEDWGYTLQEYSETSHGYWVWQGGFFWPVAPAVCRLPDFVSELQANHAVFHLATHADHEKLAVEIYIDEFGANLAKTFYESQGYIGLSVFNPEGPGWALCVDQSFIQSVNPNVKIMIDIGCKNGTRNSWWSRQDHIVGYSGPDLGPQELHGPLSDFFSMLHFVFDPNTVYSIFPPNYQFSFSEAADKNNTLKMHKGGSVALGPTFVPYLHKHYERDGPGLLDIPFELNMPCSGTFNVSSWDSEVAHVTNTGFVGGTGDMFITIHINGAGNSELRCNSHNITSPNSHPEILFNGGGGFSIQFAADTTPNACIEHFAVVNNTALIRISGKHNTDLLLIEGSNQEAGEYEELVVLPADEIELGLITVHQLPSYGFYRLRELETDGNIIIHEVTVSTAEEVSQTTQQVERVKIEEQLARIMQGEPKPRTSYDKLAIMVPSSLVNPAMNYRTLWQWHGVLTEVFITDSLWGQTTNPDVFRQNHKSFMNNLIAQGYNVFLLIGDASDNQEYQTPWPVEHGWEQKRQDMISGGAYIPQPHKNILPSQAVWYNPVLSQESGTNLPYFFTDWLLLDTSGDGWPDPCLAIGRLPFTEEWQVWNYISKLMDYVQYGLPYTPINTLMLLGDVNHFGEFDGIHAQSVMEDHIERVNWQQFHLTQSNYSSDLARATALRNAWNDDNQRWNFVVSVASYSTRYNIGRFINAAFNLNNINYSMTHNPFMFLNTCTTGNYWWTENGGVKPRVEYLLEHTNGIIGAFSHSDGSWQEQNRALGIAFTEMLSMHPEQSWGRTAAQSVQALKETGYRTRINALRTVFLGDPMVTPRAFNPDPQIPTNVPTQITLSAGLRGNHPNPFNPSTTISYDLARDTYVELCIYDVRGRKVTTLMKGTLQAGRHYVLWKGVDEQGQKLPSGTYFCLLTTHDQHTSTHKMTLVK